MTLNLKSTLCGYPGKTKPDAFVRERDIRSQTTSLFMKERIALYRILFSICLIVSHP
jgi:hypothetical protein